MTSADRIRRYYASFDEWGRLETPEGRLELRRALDLVQGRLSAPSRILDLGAGPGRYSIALARAGHRVWLADLSPELVAEGLRRAEEAGVPLEDARVVDAADLSDYAPASFQGVLAFGPFYHLVAEEDRGRAVAELARVLVPGGWLFATVMPRLTGVAGLIQRAATSPDQVSAETFERALLHGVFHNDVERGFQEGYYADPEELLGLLALAGFESGEAVSLRGLANGAAEALFQLEESNGETFRAAWELVERTAGQPSVIALGGPALVIARRRPAEQTE